MEVLATLAVTSVVFKRRVLRLDLKNGTPFQHQPPYHLTGTLSEPLNFSVCPRTCLALMFASDSVRPVPKGWKGDSQTQ